MLGVLFFNMKLNLKPLAIVVGIIYILAAAFDMRRGNLSGDEVYFRMDSEERLDLDDGRLRYTFWIAYVAFFESIKVGVPLANTAFLFFLIFNLYKLRVVAPMAILALLLLPTVLFFTNSYLRDYLFFLTAIYFLVWPDFWKKRWHGYLNCVWCLNLVSVRPVYGAFIIIAIILSSEYYSRFFRMICSSFIFAIFLITPLMLILNDDFYLLYKKFFIEGHAYNKSEFGLFMVSDYAFSNLTAAINVIISFLLFWFFPVQGEGRLFDQLMYWENLLYFLFFSHGFFRFIRGEILLDRRFRFTILMLIFSIVASAGVTQLSDIHRFRLMFVIFPIYLCFHNVKQNRGLALK